MCACNGLKLVKKYNILPKEAILGVGTILEAFFGIHLAENDEEVVALVALDEARGADECLHVGAGVTALGTRQRGGLLATPTTATSGAGPATACR